LYLYFVNLFNVTHSPKLIPWFVSDVTPPDFSAALPSLLDPSFFPPDADMSVKDHLQTMVTRWQKYIEYGIFTLSVPLSTALGASDVKANFWTSPWPYWDMKEMAKDVWEGLVGSGLVIFKAGVMI
jgi:damage-control phosphatase, subfamily III